MTRSFAFLLAALLAGARAVAADTPAAADEATRTAVQRFRAATDPAEARRAFDDLRARSTSSPHAALACGVLAAPPGSVVADRGVAIECLQRGAQAGLPEAQHRLALVLLDEPGGARRAEAEQLLAQAARELPESVYLLAKLRAARAADPDAATRSTIEQAAKAGYAPAQRELAGLSLRDGRRDEASAWLEKAAAQGDAESTFERAMLLAADGRESDVPQVVELLARASAQGSARAQYALGVRYLNADGVRRDSAQAADLFRRAAAAGLPDAQYAVGHVIADGLGTAADDALAPDLILPSLRPYRTRADVGTWVRDATVVPFLEDRLARHRYVAIGEFHVFGADADLPVMRRTVELAREHGLILHLHGDADAVERVFRQDPQARILWAHSGFTEPAVVGEMLRRHRNLWCDLAFRSDPATGGKVRPEWRALFAAHPDRFMVGTDTFTPERWLYVGEHADWAREWLADLPPALAERIAWRNGDALFAAVVRSRS